MKQVLIERGVDVNMNGINAAKMREELKKFDDFNCTTSQLWKNK